MGIKSYSPYTPSRRHMTGSDFSEITKSTPEKSLTVSKNSKAGRNSNRTWYRVRSEPYSKHRSDLLRRRRESLYPCSGWFTGWTEGYERCRG